MSDLTRAGVLESLNNLPGDGGSPNNGAARVPQYGSDDVYVYPNNYQAVSLNNVPVQGVIPPAGRTSPKPPVPPTSAAEATQETGVAA